MCWCWCCLARVTMTGSRCCASRRRASARARASTSTSAITALLITSDGARARIGTDGTRPQRGPEPVQVGPVEPRVVAGELVHQALERRRLVRVHPAARAPRGGPAGARGGALRGGALRGGVRRAAPAPRALLARGRAPQRLVRVVAPVAQREPRQLPRAQLEPWRGGPRIFPQRGQLQKPRLELVRQLAQARRGFHRTRASPGPPPRRARAAQLLLRCCCRLQLLLALLLLRWCCCSCCCLLRLSHERLCQTFPRYQLVEVLCRKSIL